MKDFEKMAEWKTARQGGDHPTRKNFEVWNTPNGLRIFSFDEVLHSTMREHVMRTERYCWQGVSEIESNETKLLDSLRAIALEYKPKKKGE